MIVSFACPETERIFRQQPSGRFPRAIQERALRKLLVLHAATSLRDELMKTRKLRTIWPGEILREEFLKPLGISQYRLAKQTGVPNTRIADIVGGRRAITADTALRLARFFGNSPRFWLNLQTEYDLRTAEEKLDTRLQREVTPLEAG